MLAEPLADPIYGSVTIDFDKRKVIDKNGYGPLDRMAISWLIHSMRSAARGNQDEMIPLKSLRDHLASRRLSVSNLAHSLFEVLSVYPDFEVGCSHLESVVESSHGRTINDVVAYAILTLPGDWLLRA